MSIYIRSHYAGTGRNFYTSLDSGEIIIKSSGHKKGIKERHIVQNGEITETFSREGKEKRHYIFGKSLKVHKKGNLIEEKYYEGDWRMKWKGLYLRQVEKDHILERYSSGGSMCREVVYYKTGQLMYNLGKGNKNIRIFNKDGLLLAKINLSEGLPLRSGKYGLHMDIPEIRKLTATFRGNWYYQLYDKDGKVCSWIKGKDSVPEDGFRNNCRLYFLRGIQVPKKVITGKYDAGYILSYPNVTIRSEMLKRYGIERVVQELKGETVEQNEQYELLQFPVPGATDPDKVMNVLKMKCPSTQVWYTLRVPPQCKNITEAINWTYGLNLNEIREGKGLEIVEAT